MTTHRARGASPPPRRYGDPRINTGPVISTGFDTRYAAYPKNSTFDTLTSQRSGADRPYDVQPISRRDYAASGHSAAQSKTEYAIRPRKNSGMGDDGRIPLRKLAQPPPSPARSRPLINNLPDDQPRSPLTKQYYAADDLDRFIEPAVSGPRHHRRQVSAAPDEGTYLIPAGRSHRERSGYRIPGSRMYPTSRAWSQYDDQDDYSYTTPREQFDRDYPPPEPGPHRNSYIRGERPTSTSDFEDWKAISQPRKEPGPPPATRQFDRIGKGEPHHPASRSGNYSDTERDSDMPRRRHSTKVPVSLHQDVESRHSPHRDDRFAYRGPQYQSKPNQEEPSYSSDRENYRPTSHYERHQPRPKVREESLDHSGRSHGVVAAGLGGLAAAGLTSALVKKSREKADESDRDEPREVRDRHLRERDHNVGESGRDRERIMEQPWAKAAEQRDEVAPREYRTEKGRKEVSDGESVDDSYTDGHRRRHKHRHRRRDSRPRELDSDSALDDWKAAGLVKEHDRDRRESDSVGQDSGLPRRDRRHSRSRQHQLSEEEKYIASPVDTEKDDDEEEDRAARLQLVEPPKQKEPEPKPKGILKPARQVPFPEDPNPTREGVAPLKDAGKKGIPPGARWTKINRMLVNPAALEAAHERFEERDDYVIVLRVLEREKIEEYAAMTKKIRGKNVVTTSDGPTVNDAFAEDREIEWPKRQERRRRKEGRVVDIDDLSDEDRGPALAIEAPPAPASTDFRYPQAFPPITNSRPEPDAAVVAGAGMRIQ